MESRKKIIELAGVLKAQFVDRDAVVEGMICAAVAGEHVLLLGPPGTAKSQLVNAFTAHVGGAKCFQWLLTQFTVPEEIWGPISFKGMREDRYSRVLTGKLAEAHVGFLDEIFKGTSSILNTLLTAINERKFHNDGVKDIPLRFVVGASNELPADPSLAALYDRFLLRYWVDYLTMPEDFKAMLRVQTTAAREVLTLEDWATATEEAAKVGVSESAYEALFRLKTSLEKESIRMSDRRWRRCIKLLQANAWLSEEEEATPAVFEVLANALWDTPEQRQTVAQCVSKVCQTSATQGQAILQEIETLVKNLPEETIGADGRAVVDRAVQEKLLACAHEGKRALARLEGLISKAGGREKAALEKLREQVERVMKPARERVREGLGL